jgi:formate-nitrite transporter family protein
MPDQDQDKAGEPASGGAPDQSEIGAAPAPEAVPGQESGSVELFREAVETGVRRLNRSWLEMGTSGLVAGMNVTFGALAAGGVAGAALASFGPESRLFAGVLGAMVFPIGFIFVVMGKSELFTENFLVPTSAVLARRSRVRSLLRLWALTLTGNMIGAVIVAKIISLEAYHGVPAVHTVDYIQHHAEFLVLERDWDASFFAGLFAGWLITLMTWLILSARDNISKIVVIWCVGFLIMMSQFNHVVVNTAEVLMAIFTGNVEITYGAWFGGNFLPTLIGNITGGLVFVTLLEYLKVLRSTVKWH